MDVSSGGKGRESFVVAGCCVAEFRDVFGELKVEVLFAGSVLGFDFALAGLRLSPRCDGGGCVCRLWLLSLFQSFSFLSCSYS